MNCNTGVHFDVKKNLSKQGVMMVTMEIYLHLESQKHESAKLLVLFTRT